MNKLSHAQPHPVSHYFTIWLGILILFVISITVAQVVDSRPLVLVTAFAIAIVQAVLVGAYFMHMKDEKGYILYLLLSMVVILGMLYMGIEEDEEHGSGQNWTATDTMKIIKEHEGHPSGGHAEKPSSENPGEHKAP